MSVLRRLLACICCLALLLALAAPVLAAQEDSAEPLLQQALNYYYHYKTTAKTDIYRLLSQLNKTDPEKAVLWQSIFEYWFYATDSLPKNETALPDGLPQDDSLCIVVLGYRLDTYGGMLPELVGRLELALHAAQKYPNAYILCTGGGTASEAPGVTEAGQMVRWLTKQGIAQERLITENRSNHTITNAQYSLEILARDYPQVRQLAIITSDYHLTRSTTLFYAQTLLTAQETGLEPITLSACLGYEAGHEGIAEDPLDQTAHVARLVGFEFQKAEAPVLSHLTDLTITGDTLLEPGIVPQLTVTAHYDSGFSRDVTADCTFSGFDPDSERTQSLTVTYAENGIQITSSLEIRRPVPETVPPATEAPETTPATEPPAPSPKAEVPIPWMLFAAAAAAFTALFIRKKK